MKNKLFNMLFYATCLGSLFFGCLHNVLAVENVFITEVMWMGDSNRQGYEWIELYNPSNDSLDLSGWSLEQTDKFNLLLASGSTITGSGFMIIARYGENYVGSSGKTPGIDYSQLDIYYDNNSQNQRYSYKKLNLPNSGTGQLILRNGSGAIIDQLPEKYYELGGFNKSGQAKKTLVRKYLQDGLDPVNWGTADFSFNLKTGSVDTANPGRWVEAPFVQPVDLSGLQISEVLANPAGADPGYEWIEFYNQGKEIIDLDQFSLVIDNSKKYSFSGQTILPEDFFILEQFNFSLGNSGQHLLEVFSATGLLVTDFSYQEPIYEGLSFSQIDEEIFFTHPTYGSGNSLANQAPQAVISLQSAQATISLGRGLNLTAEDSSDPDKDDIQCNWNFNYGSGGIIVDNCNPGYFKYEQAGHYQVVLTVTDIFGVSSTASLWVTVLNSSTGKTVKSSDYLKVNNLRDLQNIDAYKNVYLEKVRLSSNVGWLSEREAYIYDQTGALRIKVDKDFVGGEYFQAGDEVTIQWRLYKTRDGRPSSVSRAVLTKTASKEDDFAEKITELNLVNLEAKQFRPVLLKGKIEKISLKSKFVYLQVIEPELLSLKIKLSSELLEKITVGDKIEVLGLLLATIGKEKIAFTLYPYDETNIKIDSWQNFCQEKDWQNIKNNLRIKQVYPAPNVGEEEFFILENKGVEDLDLQCLQIDDALEKGSEPFTIREKLVLTAQTEMIFSKSQTKLNLNNIGDSLNLICPDGQILEGWQWDCTVVKGDFLNQENKRSYCLDKKKTRKTVSKKIGTNTKVKKTKEEKNICTDFYLKNSSTFWQNIKIKEVYPTPTKGEQEYFVIQNTGEQVVDLQCLQIDDDLNQGSRPWLVTGSLILEPQAEKIFFKKETKLTLNNNNDSLNLIWSGSTILDSWEWDCAVTKGDKLTTENQASYCQNKKKNITKKEKKEVNNIYLPIEKIVLLKNFPSQTKVIITASLNSSFELLEERTAFFEDDSGGVRVKLATNFAKNLDLKEFVVGQNYQIKGRLFNSMNGLSISYAEVFPLITPVKVWSEEGLVEPIPLEKVSRDLLFLNNKMVEYQGKIIKNSRGQVIIKDENLAVYFHSFLNFPEFKLAEVDEIKVQGLLQKKADNFKIYPLHKNDFQFTIHSPTKELLNALPEVMIEEENQGKGLLADIMGILSSVGFIGWGVVKVWGKF